MLHHARRLVHAVTGVVQKSFAGLAGPGGGGRGLGDDGLPLKAVASDLTGRFREIVADPVNVLINRDPRAGVVEQGYVYLHNGNRVAVSGPKSYYGRFSDILVINRGVHEPTEEFVFQQLLKALRSEPVMLELGAYWGHYSLWLKKAVPGSTVYLVEPESKSIAVGRHNFLINECRGIFIQDRVGKGRFTVDGFMKDTGLPRLDVLHSDIQGAEMEMLEGAGDALRQRRIDYVFVSTHSDPLHYGVLDRLESHGYVAEAAFDYEHDTCSHDGFVFAKAPDAAPVLPSLRSFRRLELLQMAPAAILSELRQMLGEQ